MSSDGPTRRRPSRGRAPRLRNRLPNPPSVFVGRRREADALEAALRRRPVTLVAGPAGIGKTALVLHVVHERFRDSVPGAVMLDVRSDDPVAQVRQEILRALAQAAGDDAIDWREMQADPEAATATAIDLAEEGGHWVVLDGIDGDDGGDLSDLLTQLASYARDSRWIAVSRRTPAIPALAGQVLVLDAMEVADLVRVAEAVQPGIDLGAARAAAAAAHGSPWALLQALAGADAAGSLLAGLPAEASGFLEVLAVLRAPLPMETLVRFAPDPGAEGLGALERRGLIVRMSDGWRVPEVVRLQLGAAAGRERREAAAAILAEMDQPPALLEAVRLLLDLGRAADAEALLQRRGDAALASGYAALLWSLVRERAEPELRRWQLRCAAELGNPTALAQVSAPPRRDDAEWLAWAWTLRAQGDTTGAGDAARQVRDRARAAADGALEARATLLLATCLRHQGRLDDALVELARARAIDPALAPRCAAAALAVRVETMTADLPEAMAEVDALVAASPEPEAIHDLALALERLGRADRAAALLDGVDVSRRGTHVALLATRMALLLRARLAIEAGDLAAAVRLADDVRPFSRGASLLAPLLALVDGSRRLAAGELEGLDGFLEAAVARARAVDAGCATRLASLRAHLGVLRARPTPDEEAAAADAWALLARARHGAGPTGGSSGGPVRDRIVVRLAVSSAALAAGDAATAAAEAETAVHEARRSAARLLRVEAMGFVCEALTVAGRAADLAATADEMAREAGALASARLSDEAAFHAAIAGGAPSPALLERLAAGESIAPVAARRAQALLGGTPQLDQVDRRLLAAVAARVAPGAIAPVGAAEAATAAWRPGWGLDDRRHAVWLPDGREVQLGDRSLLWRILVVLADHGGAASKETLILQAWRESEYHPLRHDARLHVAVRSLREAIEDRPEAPQRVVTTEDGYRLGGVVRRAR